MGDAIQARSLGTRILNHGGPEYDGLRYAIHRYIEKHSTNGDSLIGLRAAFGNGGILQGLVDWLAGSFQDDDSSCVDYIGGPESGAGVLCGALIMKLTPTEAWHWENLRGHKRNKGHIRIMKYREGDEIPGDFVNRCYPTGRFLQGPNGSQVPEYKVLAIQKGIIEEPPKNVILLDDWAETYKQLSTCVDLVESQGGIVNGAATVVSIQDGRAEFEKKHTRTRLLSLMDYERLPDKSLKPLNFKLPDSSPKAGSEDTQ
ncbi:MAG: phosphoribosyltransferase [Candidatus Aenigmarchaeota archaeon]|nr:phosphoribosyltransferase [Candidatus Aenigmarchaeota archaeon]